MSSTGRHVSINMILDGTLKFVCPCCDVPPFCKGGNFINHLERVHGSLLNWLRGGPNQMVQCQASHMSYGVTNPTSSGSPSPHHPNLERFPSPSPSHPLLAAGFEPNATHFTYRNSTTLQGDSLEAAFQPSQGYMIPSHTPTRGGPALTPYVGQSWTVANRGPTLTPNVGLTSLCAPPITTDNTYYIDGRLSETKL